MPGHSDHLQVTHFLLFAYRPARALVFLCWVPDHPSHGGPQGIDIEVEVTGDREAFFILSAEDEGITSL